MGSPYSQERTLLLAIRKSCLCTCGCRGQCTLGPLERCLVESFRVLEAGRFPEQCLDGSPFISPRDDERAALAGGLLLGL